MKTKHIIAQEHNMEETDESETDEFEIDEFDTDDYEIEVIECNCLKKRIKQRIAHLITAPLTQGEIFCLCIYQFIVILAIYSFILKMNMVENCLRILTTIISDTIVSDSIIASIAQTIKIMMMLHLFEESRLLIKALVCKCD